MYVPRYTVPCPPPPMRSPIETCAPRVGPPSPHTRASAYLRSIKHEVPVSHELGHRKLRRLQEELIPAVVWNSDPSAPLPPNTQTRKHTQKTNTNTHTHTHTHTLTRRTCPAASCRLPRPPCSNDTYAARYCDNDTTHGNRGDRLPRHQRPVRGYAGPRAGVRRRGRRRQRAVRLQPSQRAVALPCHASVICVALADSAAKSGRAGAPCARAHATSTQSRSARSTSATYTCST